MALRQRFVEYIIEIKVERRRKQKIYEHFKEIVERPSFGN
jgi:hypothetical protein